MIGSWNRFTCCITVLTPPVIIKAQTVSNSVGMVGGGEVTQF